MGLLMYLLLCSRVCIIINAHDFMAEHTLIRASMKGREARRRTERTGCTQHDNTGLQTVCYKPKLPGTFSRVRCGWEVDEETF